MENTAVIRFYKMASLYAESQSLSEIVAGNTVRINLSGIHSRRDYIQRQLNYPRAPEISRPVVVLSSHVITNHCSHLHIPLMQSFHHILMMLLVLDISFELDNEHRNISGDIWVVHCRTMAK